MFLSMKNKKLLFQSALLAICSSAFLQATNINSTASSGPSLSKPKEESVAQQPGKLIFAIDIIRHGDRTPLSNIPTVEHVWPEGLGQLTTLGMAQEYALGQEMRKRYITQGHFLPESYVPGSIYVRSTDFDRTLVSAQSLLLGLFPLGTGPTGLPEKYQPVPIHTIPFITEDILIPDDNVAFNYNTLLQRYVSMPKSSEEWHQKEKALKSKFPQWSAATGRPISSLYDLKSLSDALSLNQAHHVPMPANLSADDVSTITTVGQWALYTAFQNKVLGQVTGANLLHQISDYLKAAAITPHQPLKYVLYSAHETTILGQLSALGAPLSEVPPFASDLNIRLFKQGSGKYVVTVTLNNKPIILPCSNSDTCSLDQFESLAQQAVDQLKKFQASEKAPD